jgi:hypothetical protein
MSLVPMKPPSVHAIHKESEDVDGFAFYTFSNSAPDFTVDGESSSRPS